MDFIVSTCCEKIIVMAKQVKEESRDTTKENKKQDLRSRGLCLVAIPSTAALANGNTLDFWSPTFGGTFR